MANQRLATGGGKMTINVEKWPPDDVLGQLQQYKRNRVPTAEPCVISVKYSAGVQMRHCTTPSNGERYCPIVRGSLNTARTIASCSRSLSNQRRKTLILPAPGAL